MNGPMIDVHGTREFNVLDDTDTRFLGILQCVIFQSTCDQFVSREVKFQTFNQFIRNDEVDNCNYMTRVKDQFKPTEKKVGSKS